MTIGNSYARTAMLGARCLSFPVYRCRADQTVKLTRFKLSADKLAGKCFKEEIERQSRYNVVDIEVSFVSTGCDSDKPEKIMHQSIETPTLWVPGKDRG